MLFRLFIISTYPAVNEPCVLVVQAQQRQRAKLSFYLRAAGFRVESADSFQEARTRISLRSINCVVAGVKLGVYNGLHLVSQLWRDDSPVSSVVTHDSEDQVLEREARLLGAEFLVLPCSDEELVGAVRQAIARKSLNPVSSK